jgi:hypothetical protein
VHTEPLAHAAAEAYAALFPGEALFGSTAKDDDEEAGEHAGDAMSADSVLATTDAEGRGGTEGPGDIAAALALLQD